MRDGLPLPVPPAARRGPPRVCLARWRGAAGSILSDRMGGCGERERQAGVASHGYGRMGTRDAPERTRRAEKPPFSLNSLSLFLPGCFFD
eukprot:scaffold932_cov97-Isochrysis_galbana.AAC.5